MIFNHLESLPEEIEEGGEPEDLEGIIWIVELSIDPEQPIDLTPAYDVPQDNYLEQELERQNQEDLGKMLPIRNP